MNIFDLTAVGLGTRYDYAQDATWCGMRARADAFMVEGMKRGHRVGQFVHGWHEGWFDSPETIANRVIDQWKGGMNGEPYDFAFGRAHSFGGDWMIWFVNALVGKLSGSGLKFKGLCVYDPVDNWERTGWENWFLPGETVDAARCIFQQGGRPVGISGRELPARINQVAYNVTHRNAVVVNDNNTIHREDWSPGDELDHISLIVADRSIQVMDAFALSVLDSVGAAA